MYYSIGTIITRIWLRSGNCVMRAVMPNADVNPDDLYKETRDYYQRVIAGSITEPIVISGSNGAGTLIIAPDQVITVQVIKVENEKTCYETPRF